MKVGWESTTVGAVASVNAGNSAPQKKELFAGGTHPFFRTSDAGRIRFGDIFEAADNLNDNGIARLREFPKGTILFPKSGASTFLNHRVMLGVKGFVSSHLAAIVGDESKVDRRFLLYFLSTVSAQDLVQDHAYPSLKLPEIANIQIALPSLSEQRRIVGILDEAFEGIAKAVGNAEANLNNARELFESHLNAAFSNPGPDWIEKKFGDICDIKHGFAFKSEFFVPSSKYILLTPGNFFEAGGYRDRGEKQKFYDGPIPNGFVLSKGDLLIAMTEQAAGLLGSSIIIPESGIFLHNQRLGLVKAKEGVPWDNEFFSFAFNTKAIRKAIHDDASGVKVRHTSPKKIAEIPVSFPPSTNEQQTIVAKLKELAAETKRLEVIYQQKLALLAELKQSLLHKAFSGEL